MATVDDALKWARAQLGTVGGSKYWQMVEGWSGGGWAWCAIWCSALKKAVALVCNYFPNRCAFDRSDKGTIGDQWVEPYYLEAGDFLAFDWNSDGSGDHVGIVELKLGWGTYQTIEGNVSNTCGRRKRTVTGDHIVGGIRPRYDGGSSDGKLVVDGVFGALTIKALQSALQSHFYYRGYLIDGDWGYYSKLETQRYLRSKGTYTTAYLLDGWFGTASVKALQTYLRRLGYYTTAYLIDGDWGEYTTRALQCALNDGKF